MTNKINYYATPHFLSQKMGEYIAQGFKARIVPANVLLEGKAITYGILRGTGEIIKECLRINNPLLYVDHSFFFQTRTTVDNPSKNGYFRIIKNGRYFHDIPDMPSDRWDKLRIKIKPWNKKGTKIIVVPMSRYVGMFNGIDAREWLNRTIQLISEMTDREIMVKPKDDNNNIKGLDDLWRKAWCVVVADSNVALSSLINGVPVICSKDNPAYSLATNDFSRLEDPIYSDNREQLLYNLSYQQFTVEEICNGEAKEILEET